MKTRCNFFFIKKISVFSTLIFVFYPVRNIFEDFSKILREYEEEIVGWTFE